MLMLDQTGGLALIIKKKKLKSAAFPRNIDIQEWLSIKLLLSNYYQNFKSGFCFCQLRRAETSWIIRKICI